MIYGIGVGVYCLIMILIGVIVSKRTKTAEDYLIASRSFGTIFNTSTLTACFIGGTLLLGYPGQLYIFGFWDDAVYFGAIAAFGGSICLLVAGLFYLPKMWRLKLLSLGDFFYQRFNRAVGITMSLLCVVTFTLWITAQILVFAKVCSVLLDWPLLTSILIATFVVGTYTVLGGLWAVAATDIVQIVILAVGIVILAPYAVDLVGGWESFTVHFPSEKFQFFPGDEQPPVAWLAWMAVLLVTGIGGITSPDLMQRSFSAKTAKVCRNSALIASVFNLFIMLFVGIIAVGGIIMINNGILDPGIILEDGEMLVPVMVKKIFPIPLVVLFLGACLSAVMSAGSSSLIALAGMASKNIWKDMLRPQCTGRELLLVSRILVGAFIILAGIIAVNFSSIIYVCFFGFDLILCCLFAPFTLGLFWKKANAAGALCGMLAGFCVRVIGSGLENGFTLEGLATSTEHWYYYTWGGPLTAMLVMVIVSLLTQKISPPKVLKEYD